MKLGLLLSTLIAGFVCTSVSTAQTQLVRGDVDSIQGTNRFVLDCTFIELVSSTVNLQALENQSRQSDIEYDMQVQVVSTNPTVLNVISATVAPEMMQMGNLRLGETDSWEVNGTPGSNAWVFLGDRAFTLYGPAGPLGTWLLGGPVALLNQGTIAFNGQFRFNFTMPNEPRFLGTEITAQAIVQLPAGNFMITNPDCKEIEN